MKCTLQVAGLVLALSPLVAAQNADPVTREMVERLLSRIDTLEKRVADLEKEKGGAPVNAMVAAPSTPARPSEQQVHLDHDQPPAPSEAARSTYPGAREE